MACRLRLLFYGYDRGAGFLQRNWSVTTSSLRHQQIRLLGLRLPSSFSNSSVSHSLFCINSSSSSICSSSSSSSCSSSFCSIRSPSYSQRASWSDQAATPTAAAAAAAASSVNVAVAAAAEAAEIFAERLDGFLAVSVPMPSRQEKCRFVLKPLANTLFEFVNFIKVEDSAIERVSAYTEDNQVLSGTTSIDLLFSKNFYLHVNDQRYLIRVPESEDVVPEKTGEDLPNIRDTIARLFRALSSDQLHVAQQRHLQARLEEINTELEPLEKLRQELHARATKRTRVLSWVGLGLMGLQFGFLARLTWWEYSWDIMEPVTCFLTYGTAMAMYAYYLLTIQDYVYPDAHDREVVMTIHKLAKKNSFDVTKYNQLRSEKSRLENDLERLRHPLEMKLHPPYLPPVAASANNDEVCKSQ